MLKKSIVIKNGVWGVAPSGVRAAAPHSAPSRGEGVFGKDAEIRTHQALHEAKLSECPKGDRDREFALSYKNRLFLQAGPLLMSGLFLSPIIIYRITAV